MTSGRKNGEGIPEAANERGGDSLPNGLLESLRDARAYPAFDSASGSAGLPVEEIQTHISHVFLVGDRVYKLRKAVHLGFLSFASRVERNADCVREVSLNRRLNEDVYLGVVAIEARPEGGWRVGELNPMLASAPRLRSDLEHCVVMRRLPEGRNGLDLLARGELESRHVDAVAERLVSFHAEQNLGAPAPYAPGEWLERVYAPVQVTLDLMREADSPEIPASDVDSLGELIRERFDARSEEFETRRREGRVVDGHGDIHLDHVWFEAGRDAPTIVDCLEFDAELRRIDVAAELAFLAMDLIYRARPDLAARLLHRYAAATDDFGLYSTIDFHIVHRALVRASVAGIAMSESEIDDSQRSLAAESAAAHLGLARRVLEAPSRAVLVLLSGSVGSGKSTIAEEVAEQLSGALISSDRTRKLMAGLTPETRVGGDVDGGLYDQEQTRRTYAGLLERARMVLDSGRPVILDATYSTRTSRDPVRDLGNTLGVRVLLVHARCDIDVARRRLRERQISGQGASDAGPDFLEESVRRYESPTEWSESERIEVDTNEESWRDRLAAALKERDFLRPPPAPSA